MQDERFTLYSVIGVSLEEILRGIKQISVESQLLCVNFNVCGYLISSLQFYSLCTAFILQGCFFFLVCAVGWQVESNLAKTNGYCAKVLIALVP